MRSGLVVIALLRTSCIIATHGIGTASKLASSGASDTTGVSAAAPVSPPASHDCFAVPVIDRVRFFPRTGNAARMLGGKIVGSNTSANNGFVDLLIVTSTPADGQWTELPVPATTAYRFVKYYGPAGSGGELAEMQLFSGGTQVSGTAFGTPSTGATHPATNAFDGDTTTFFEGAVANDQYVGLDLGADHVVATPTFSPAGGHFTEPTQVTLSGTPGAVIHYSTDGSDPRVGQIFDRPFPVSTTTVVQAVASADCMLDSVIAESVFAIGAPNKNAQSSFHIGNSLTGPIIAELPLVVGLQSKFSLDFHNCTSSGVDVGDFWAAATPPGCSSFGVNPLPTPEGGVADPKVALQTPSLLPPIDNLVVQPFAVDICTPYSDSTHTGDGGYANDFYQLAKSRNNPAVQLWIYATWSAPTAQNWWQDDCFANGGDGTPTWPGAGVTLSPVSDWESATRNHMAYHEAVRREVDIANGVDPSSLSTPGPHARIVPMGLALINLKHEVEGGTVHDVAPTDFFTTFYGSNGTDLHINNVGGYFDALLFYACFFQTSPEGMPVDTSSGATAAEGADLQRIAWQTAATYPWSGIQ